MLELGNVNAAHAAVCGHTRHHAGQAHERNAHGVLVIMRLDGIDDAVEAAFTAAARTTHHGAVKSTHSAAQPTGIQKCRFPGNLFIGRLPFFYFSPLSPLLFCPKSTLPSLLSPLSP